MLLTRRRLLKIVIVGVGGVAAASIAGFSKPLRFAYHRLASPAMRDAPTGLLNDQALRTLLATTEAVADVSVEKGHYADYFRWRSEHLRGYRVLYERFTATVNQSTRRSVGCDFADCEVAARRRVLEKAFQTSTQSRLRQLWKGVFQRDWVQFDRYIVGEIQTLFVNTDAWKLLGYEAWPGTPRGLDRYRYAAVTTGWETIG